MDNVIGLWGEHGIYGLIIATLLAVIAVFARLYSAKDKEAKENYREMLKAIDTTTRVIDKSNDLILNLNNEFNNLPKALQDLNMQITKDFMELKSQIEAIKNRNNNATR